MDILDTMPIIIESENINNAYLKLLAEFISEDNMYESRSAIISIKNIYNSQLPIKYLFKIRF